MCCEVVREVSNNNLPRENTVRCTHLGPARACLWCTKIDKTDHASIYTSPTAVYTCCLYEVPWRPYADICE